MIGLIQNMVISNRELEKIGQKLKQDELNEWHEHIQREANNPNHQLTAADYIKKPTKNIDETTL